MPNHNPLTTPLVAFQAVETDERRGYWLDQPWVDPDRRGTLLAAAILALPSEAEEGRLFPGGAGEFLDRLRDLVGDEIDIQVAIRDEDYEELSLHGKAWRLPVLFVSAVAVPVMVNILSNRLDELLPGHKAGDVAEATLIIERPDRQSLKVTYKGDPEALGAFLATTVPKFIEQPKEDTTGNAAPAAAKGTAK